MQCLEILQRPPSNDDTLALTDAQEEVEHMLSAYLMNGYCLLEQACPACNVPLVKLSATNDNDSFKPVVSVHPTIPSLSPLSDIAFCVKCHAHVVANTTEFQLVQGHDTSQEKRTIYFLSESLTATESIEGDTTSKETGTVESTVVTRSDVTHSARSSSSSLCNDYDESLATTSYQLEEIEVVLAGTEDVDDIDDETAELDVAEDQQQTMTKEYPEPSNTQRINSIDPISLIDTKNETEIVTSPRDGVELSLHDHENLLQQARQNDNHNALLRTVDLDEIELQGCGEEVSLLAIDENMIENKFFNEIEQTKSHETAVDLAIQQSASRNLFNNNLHYKMSPILLDFPMPEFHIRREIAIKVLAGKMVQGFSIMDGQCESCLMPQMCDAKNKVVHCFVCRSIRKSYFKSLAVHAVENRCSPADSDLLQQRRQLDQQKVTVPEIHDQQHLKRADSPVEVNESITVASNKLEEVVLSNSAASTFSYGKNDTGTYGSDTQQDTETDGLTMTERTTDVMDVATTACPVELKTTHNSNDIEPSETLAPYCEGTTRGIDDIVTEKTSATDNIVVREMIDVNDKILDSEVMDTTRGIGDIASEKICASSNDEMVVKEIINDEMLVKEVGGIEEIVSEMMSGYDETKPQVDENNFLTDEDFSGVPIQEGKNDSEILEDQIDDDVNKPVLSECKKHDEISEAVVPEYDPAIDLVRIEMSNRTQRGWTLLDKTCPQCVLPLMTDEFNTSEICIHCDIVAATSEKGAALSEHLFSEHPTEATIGRDNDTDDAVKVEIDEIASARPDQSKMLTTSNTDEYVSDLATSTNDEHTTAQTFSGNLVNFEPIDALLFDGEHQTISAFEGTEYVSKVPTELSEERLHPEDSYILKESFIEEHATEEINTNIAHTETSEPVIENTISYQSEPVDAAMVEKAIDAEKMYIAISESKSIDQQNKPTIQGPLHWITAKTSSSEKSAKARDPPGSNNILVTDIFSRNSRRLGPPGGSRFRSNKSPEGFHRDDVRSCSPMRTVSPEIQAAGSIELIDLKNEDGEELILQVPDQFEDDARIIQTHEIIETPVIIHLDSSPRLTEGWDDERIVENPADVSFPYSKDTRILEKSQSLDTAQNFVRLELPKSMSCNDRAAIVRLIEVATLTDSVDLKNDAILNRVGLRSASPGNSVANMPHSFPSTPTTGSYTSSAKSGSARSHSSKRSNNPPSPENHTVIDCTSPSNGMPKRAPSPGLSEAPNPRTMSDTSSVVSNDSSRASRNNLPSSVYSASTGQKSQRSTVNYTRSRATPETTIRSRKPGLPLYIPGNPNRHYFTGSRSYQQPLPSASTAFSKTATKNRISPTTSYQSTRSVKSLPLTSKSPIFSHFHGNRHINSTFQRSISWRERRDEILLRDETDTNDRDIDLVDADKLDALLRRIENTKSQLENADDVMSQYRMRDLIVNLTRSAEILQHIEES